MFSLWAARALIDSYPDLGAPSVAAGEEGEGSKRDQSSLELDRLDEKDHGELSDLAREYREHFGFPLIIAVRDRNTFEDMVTDGWMRMDNSPAQEHAAALVEIAKIAAHRYDDLLAGANPVASARQRFMRGSDS